MGCGASSTRLGMRGGRGGGAGGTEARELTVWERYQARLPAALPTLKGPVPSQPRRVRADARWLGRSAVRSGGRSVTRSVGGSAGDIAGRIATEWVQHRLINIVAGCSYEMTMPQYLLWSMGPRPLFAQWCVGRAY